LLSPERLRSLLEQLGNHAATRVVLQRCRSESMLDPSLGEDAMAWPDGVARLSAEQWLDQVAPSSAGG